MGHNNYQCSITANTTTREAFNIINNNIADWWTNQFEGSAKELDDVFMVSFSDVELTIKTVGFVPGRKIFWRVIDCNLPRLKNRMAWAGTQIVWQFLPGNCSTEINMLHIGLTPDAECYEESAESWNLLLKKNLFNYLNKPKRVAKVVPIYQENSHDMKLSFSF